MRTTHQRWGAVRVAVVVASMVPVAAYVWIAVRRMAAPFELEWIEGGVVDEVRRAGHGHSLYVPPTLKAIPYIYTPLYYYVCVPFAAVLGQGFFALRLVSFLSSLVAFAAAAVLVTRETRDRVAGAVTAGTFAGCFVIGGAWFDLARVDSLFLALMFAGLAVARHGRGVRTGMLAGLLLGLAVLAKQQALLPAAAPVLFLGLSDRRRAVAYAGTVGAVLATSTALFQLTSHGWYLRYIVELPAGHATVEQVRRTFWTEDLRPLAVAIAVAVLVLGWAVVRREEHARPLLLFHLPVGASLLASSYLSRLHSGGYDNVLLPGYGALAVLFGLGFALLQGRPATSARAVAVIAVVVQLLMLSYDPRDQIPTPSEVRRAHVLDGRLRRLPGPVLMTGHGWYLARIGRPTTAQGAAIADVLRGDVGSTSHDLERELRDDIAHQRYRSIVVDSIPVYSYLPATLRRYYRRVGPLLPGGSTVLPLTGTKTGPATVWAPRARS